jgi:3-oxoacyl-[acyl-carrier protein] reductase
MIMHTPVDAPTLGPLAGKVAIVTGSSRSIGAAVAQRLAADGANVVINFHKVPLDAERTAECINAHSASHGGGRAIVVKADVSTVEGGQHLLDACLHEFGVPDILVLNAAVMAHTRLSQTKEADFDLTFNTNVKGPLFLVQAAAEKMQPGKFGRVYVFCFLF